MDDNSFVIPSWVDKIRFVPDVKEFAPIPLPNKDGQTNTRKVVNARFINPNPRNPNAPLEISICHQRKKASGEYEDCEHFSLSKLPAGQEIRMTLDTEQTLALEAILNGLYEYCQQNLGMSTETTPIFTLEKAGEIVRVTTTRQAIIQKLVDGSYEDEFWQELEKLNPDGATKLSHARIFTLRNQALKEFEEHLIALDWNESKWQEFFENNTWIFGYGLSYKWVEAIGKKFEQVTTGASIDGSGKRPDGFIHTVAEIAMTAFVDIKRPDTPLLEKDEYRPEVFLPSSEVSGGVSQVQVTIQKWLGTAKHNVFFKKDSEGFTESEPIHSYQPKGLLIVGSLDQFKRDGKYHEAKISSFELYRRQLTNPEVITFDEIFNRAQRIIEVV